MKKTEKAEIIQELASKIKEYPHFYVTDTFGMNAAETTALRRLCYQQDVQLVVVKNTLFSKAIQASERDIEGIDVTLKGVSAIMFTNTGNLPAKLIKDFSKKTKRPVLKGAFVEESVYVGANQLDTLATIKSKEELIGDVIALLQSPIKNVVSALQSGGTTIHGILKTLEERN